MGTADCEGFRCLTLLRISVLVQVVEAYRAVDAKERPSSGPGGWWKAFFQPFGLFRVSGVSFVLCC